MIERQGGLERGKARWFVGFENAARLAACAVFLIVLGCATPGGGGLNDASPEARRGAVTERANARWAALIRGDLDAAYAYMSPASRELVSLDQFKVRMRTSGFREAKVDSVECEAEACKVHILLTYDHRLMSGITTPLLESWVLDKGQYWYVWQL